MEYEMKIAADNIGAQFRHCLEVYQCFIKGLDETYVDYDNRFRLKDLEK